MPKVSVILTSYNHNNYIREAIDSVLQQTFSDFELIIWDDASADGSWKIIQSYSDPRIYAFRNNINEGPVFGINKAISEIAKGDYIAMHHSDDVWELNKLEMQVSFLDNNQDIGAVFTNALAIDEDSLPLKDDSHFYANVFDKPNRTRHEWLRFFFSRGNALCHPSLLIRKQCYDDCGLYRPFLAQLPDFDMWIRLCLKYEIYVLPERLVKFRVHANEANTSGSRPDTRIRTNFEYYKLLVHYQTINTFDELLKVFPNAQKYNRDKETNCNFAIAMLALEEKNLSFMALFAQDILFEIISDPKQATQIKQFYNFDYFSFIKLTAEHDVFSYEEIIRLHHVISEQNKALTLIQDSRSWRITAPIRYVFTITQNMITLVKLAPNIIQRNGGIAEVTQKACRVFFREGWKGVERRVLALNKNDYSKWVRYYDTLTDESRKKVQLRIAKFQSKPLISVLLPVYNPTASFLESAIQSIRTQLYPHWELCIAVDSATNSAICEMLDSYCKQEHRIKVSEQKINHHISMLYNAALELAQGEFIALFEQNDLLAEHALYCIAESINRQPNVRLIYSDEDKIDESGRRYDPHFKCEFNYELLLAQNMICHLGAYQTELVKKIGGFLKGVDGAQDYDLAFRMIEKLNPNQIFHIPHVLYHQRVMTKSATLIASDKNYAAVAGRKVVAEHIKRMNISAEVIVAPDDSTFNRVRFTCPSPQPLVSIIIPTRDRADLLGMCLNSLMQRSTYTNYEVIIIDNNSVENATQELFNSLPKERFRVLRDNSPFNFSALNNKAARIAKGELLCLMNNDIEILTPEWLEEMVSFAIQSDIGCVGARLWYPDGSLQHGGVILGIGGMANHAHYKIEHGNSGYLGRAVLHQSFSAVTGACLLVRHSIFKEVKGLDEQLTIAFNDVDFCLRVREAGYRNVWTPYAEMNHHESASRGQEDTPAKKERFFNEIYFMQSRWGDKILNDPAYSPNLTLDSEDFSLAWPPRTNWI